MKELYLAIIGGSGLYELLKPEKVLHLLTPFGRAPPIFLGKISSKLLAFANRHTKPGSLKPAHEVPPHRINYRALIYGLRSIGVKRIIATNAVGSLRDDMRPGDFVIVHQFMDFTKGRNYTFYDGETEISVGDFKASGKLVHLDVTEPFCPELRSIILDCAEKLGIKVHREGVYACMEGPRFETPAEINALKVLGASLVGMTLVPEVVLARELNMCYSSICVISNYAAGMQERVSHEEVMEVFNKALPKLKRLINCVIERVPLERSCLCKSSVRSF